MEVSSMMQAQEVLEIVLQLEGAGVVVWLDGGWGVDALLGRQTRPHDDVDVVISFDQAPLAEEALCGAGYIVTEVERPTRFVMCASQDLRVDFHPVTFDRQGDGLQRLPNGTDLHYPREGFTGRGSLGDHTVCCITAEAQVLCHLRYEPDEKDLHDLLHIREHFQLDLPAGKCPETLTVFALNGEHLPRSMSIGDAPLRNRALEAI
jgi:lincosamide nucleotidyltransferase A/C/D/E